MWYKELEAFFGFYMFFYHILTLLYFIVLELSF